MRYAIRDLRRTLRAWLLRAVVAVVPALVSGALWVLGKTVRMRFVNSDALFARWARGEQVILAFWHDRLLMLPLAYRGRKVCIMNSQHRDGEIATRAAARWGVRSVRGSATRGGVGAFLQLVDAFGKGYDLAIVPDGPRGPRHVAKPGVVHLARATGAPIFPVTYAAARRRRLHSWDRMILPLPFSLVLYRAGEPIEVPEDADDEQLKAKRLALQAELNRITELAETEVQR